MRLVVDTNIAYSALLKSSRIHRLLITEQRLEPHAPKVLLDEIEKHIPRIRRYTGFTVRELRVIWEILVERIKIHREEEYTDEMEEAMNLLRNVDLSDAPFIALAMHLDTPLWTGDKALIRKGLETGEYIAVDTEGVELLLRGEPLDSVLERMREKYLR